MNGLDAEHRKRYETFLRNELEAAEQYEILAEAERDARRAQVFHEMARMERRHAAHWAKRLGVPTDGLPRARRTVRMRFLGWLARRFGTRSVASILLRGEASDIRLYDQEPGAEALAEDERQHALTLRVMQTPGAQPSGAHDEGWGRSSNSGTLRAAVLGGNDGLVSNFSLVMGVVGADVNGNFVAIAGMAGLLAGAFSMAAGEYISMKSQREVYEYQIAMERMEIKDHPEGEFDELVGIYRAKGLTDEEAGTVARRIMRDPEVALDTMAREELGLDPSELGSPWGAALSSFLAFAIGAIFPVAPYLFLRGPSAFTVSVIASAVALLGVGGALAWLTQRNVLFGAARMLVVGALTASVTYLVGKAMGVTLAA